jgi:hypothetical protein
VRFATFLSGGFTTMAVINPLERKLAKLTSVQCIGVQGTADVDDLLCMKKGGTQWTMVSYLKN